MNFIMFLLIAISALFIGSVVIAILLGIGESLYEKAYDYFYPRPALSEEDMTEILHVMKTQWTLFLFQFLSHVSSRIKVFYHGGAPVPARFRHRWMWHTSFQTF